MSARTATADRRLVAGLGGGLVVLVVAVVLLVASGSGAAQAPPDEAARLVPADALVYVHLSTDTGRGATRTALRLAQGFPSFARVRDSLLRRLGDSRCGSSLRSQHGREAALALLNSPSGTAGSLVLVDTGKDHPGAAMKACGLVSQGYIGRFLAIGQPASLAAARALARAKDATGSLARDPSYARATSGLPAERVADGWASAAGVRRLLAPQGGVLGAAGVLLDQPGLVGAAMGLIAHEHGARIVVRNELSGGSRAREFAPKLQRQAPKGALAYFGVSGLASALSRVFSAAGPQTAGLGALLQRTGRLLDRQSGGRLTREVIGALQGEVGVTLTPSFPAPVLTIVAHAKPQTASTLAQLEAPIARLLGRGARFQGASAGGQRMRVLHAGPITIAYAVLGERLVISTAPLGIAVVARGGDHLDGQEAFRSVSKDAPGRVSSLLFLDFTELLRLGEQTGLGGSPAYRSVRDDLRKVRAVGAWSSGSGDESNAEINLSIP